MEICDGATLDDIDNAKVRGFLKDAKIQRKYPIDEHISVEDALAHLGLLNKGKLTNASVLLFGKNPQKLFLQAELKCVHFHGTEIEKPFKTYHVYGNNIFQQIDNGLDFVLDRLKRPVIIVPGEVATNRPYELPEFVVREALVNAIAHRDYSSSASVQIMVFSDRIEIWNPGYLPTHIKIDDLRKSHPSIPRNPIISHLLYLANYIEKAGSGTLEMINQCKMENLPEPLFEQKMGSFIITIWRNILTDEYLTNLGLNNRQKNAVKYILQHNSINRRTYCKINNIGPTLAYKELINAEESNILERKGMGRSVYYILRTKRTINERLD